MSALPDPGHSGDDGSPDAGLAAALAAHAVDPAREPEVLRAIAAARLLVPVVARAGDNGTEMALAVLVGVDGRRALPAFTGMAAMAAWDRDARPVPVSATQAALSAAAEGAPVLVLDVAGPVSFLLTGAALRRLAEGDAFVPAYADRAVRAAVAAVLGSEPGVSAGWLTPAAGVDARVTLAVAAGVDAAAVATRVAQRLRVADAVRAVALRGLDIALLVGTERPAEDPVFTQPSLE